MSREFERDFSSFDFLTSGHEVGHDVNLAKTDEVERAITRRADGFRVLRPEDCRTHPSETARIIIEILAANYGDHALTNSVEALCLEIAEGKVLPFICLDQAGRPFSCAALIAQSPLEIEIGRGASLPWLKNQGGALPLLLASRAWQRGEVFPDSKMLRAEIRVAKNTKAVPGGEATQAICFKTMGLTPTAIAPLFHHGNPDRQEMFFLASKLRNRPFAFCRPEVAPLPSNLFDNVKHESLFIFFWRNCFGEILPFLPPREPCADQVLECLHRFQSHQDGPLLIVEPSQEIIEERINSQLNRAFANDIRFALARIPWTMNQEELIIRIQALRGVGFRIIGFEPLPNGEGGKLSANLLLGKLSWIGRQKLIAPTFIEGPFPRPVEDLLLGDFLSWRTALSFGGY